MRTRPLQSLVALILTVAMTVMGYGAAAARGQTTVEGRVLVLCSGGGLIQITLDENGQPTGQSHLCPDLAYSVLAAIDSVPPQVMAPARVLSETLHPAQKATLRADRHTRPNARAPPVRL